MVRPRGQCTAPHRQAGLSSSAASPDVRKARERSLSPLLATAMVELCCAEQAYDMTLLAAPTGGGSAKQRAAAGGGSSGGGDDDELFVVHATRDDGNDARFINDARTVREEL